MSITKRIAADGKPRYLVRIDVGDATSGERTRATVGNYRTKREAQNAQAKAKLEHERGTLLMPNTTTVGQLLDRWLEVVAPKTVAPENLVNYETTIRKHLKPALGTIPLQKLTAEHVERFYADLQRQGYSSSLIKKCHMRLAATLRMAKRYKLVNENVCDLAKPPRLTTTKFEVWTLSETAAFLDVAATDALFPYWAFAIETGARTSELLGLSWDDVDFERGRVQFGHRVVRTLKGKSIIKHSAKTEAGHRTVLVTLPMVETLRKYRVSWNERQLKSAFWDNPHQLIFCTNSGRPIDQEYLRRSFNQLIRGAGVRRITPHGMRKTHITSLVAAGGNIKAIAARVGHRDVTTTLKTYTQLVPQMEDELLELVNQIARSTERSA